MPESWSNTMDGLGEVEGLPEMETVQQFRLISADIPLKIDRDALALDMKKDELLPSLVYAEDLLSGPAYGMGRPKSFLDGTSKHEASAEPMRVKVMEESQEAVEDVDEAVATGCAVRVHVKGDSPSVETEIPAEWQHITTIMMRNLPNKYTQRMLLLEVNHAGFLGAFDFFYLPIDTETGANRGYAFLNFLDPALAWMFRLMYEGRKMSRFNSSKVITVVPATLQGFEANYMHYAFSRVSRGDPAARPLFLRAAMAWSESDGTSQPDVEANGLEPAVNYVPKFCSQCGGRIQLMFVFCPSCGQALDFS